MESPGVKRGFCHPILAYKLSTQVMTLLPNASVHSLIHSSLGNICPLHKLQALEGPRTLQSKLWPLDQDGILESTQLSQVNEKTLSNRVICSWLQAAQLRLEPGSSITKSCGTSCHLRTHSMPTWQTFKQQNLTEETWNQEALLRGGTQTFTILPQIFSIA